MGSAAFPQVLGQTRLFQPKLSFQTLFRNEFTYVWRSLRRLGVVEHDCDDLANEVFFRVSEKYESYDRERPLRPWLFAFAARVASDYRKLARHRRETPLDSGHDLVDDASDVESRLVDREETDLVLAAMECLSMDKRTVFVMHEIDEHPIPEIAAALGIAVPTAYSRLRAARLEFTEAARRLQAIRSRRGR